MTNQHNCIRNPNTGACYVCAVPMRQTFHTNSPLDASIDVTQHPNPQPTAKPHLCECGEVIKASENTCVECWIKEQTKQPPPKPKTQPKPLGAISLDSIVAMMETNTHKWN